MGQLSEQCLRTASAVCLLLGLAPAAQATEATLIADAHVSSARPSVNSGAISNLYVGSGYTALVQFSLASLPGAATAAQVSKATLRIYCNRVDTPGSVTLEAVGSSWGEYSVTFATLPSLGAALQTAQVTQAGAYITFDVTATVQGWIASPATNNGFAITAATSAVQFDSKENDLTAHPASLDVTLVSQGPAGAIGPAGPAGPAGANGATGPTGPSGATGATGPAGASGPAGPQGPAGGLSYQGTYTSTSNYDSGAVVSYAGSSYSSLVSANHGNTPPLYPAFWGLLAAAQIGPTGPAGPQGSQGVAGPAGPLGVAGPQGPAGVAGPTGPLGLPGLVYQGAYASTTNYALGDVVLWAGASYTSLLSSNHGSVPDQNPQAWGLLTAPGPAGATGAGGLQGIAGPQGAPGSVGPPGEQGAQGLQGIAGQNLKDIDALEGPMRLELNS